MDLVGSATACAPCGSGHAAGYRRRSVGVAAKWWARPFAWTAIRSANAPRACGDAGINQRKPGGRAIPGSNDCQRSAYAPTGSRNDRSCAKPGGRQTLGFKASTPTPRQSGGRTTQAAGRCRRTGERRRRDPARRNAQAWQAAGPFAYPAKGLMNAAMACNVASGCSIWGLWPQPGSSNWRAPGVPPSMASSCAPEP